MKTKFKDDLYKAEHKYRIEMHVDLLVLGFSTYQVAELTGYSHGIVAKDLVLSGGMEVLRPLLTPNGDMAREIIFGNKCDWMMALEKIDSNDPDYRIYFPALMRALSVWFDTKMSDEVIELINKNFKSIFQPKFPVDQCGYFLLLKRLNAINEMDTATTKVHFTQHAISKLRKKSEPVANFFDFLCALAIERYPKEIMFNWQPELMIQADSMVNAQGPEIAKKICCYFGLQGQAPKTYDQIAVLLNCKRHDLAEVIKRAVGDMQHSPQFKVIRNILYP